MKCDTCAYKNYFDDQYCDGCSGGLNYKKTTNEWLIPATKEPWKSGTFGMCSHCNYVNHHVKIAPNFCENCGAPMKNANMK